MSWREEKGRKGGMVLVWSQEWLVSNYLMQPRIIDYTRLMYSTPRLGIGAQWSHVWASRCRPNASESRDFAPDSSNVCLNGINREIKV